MEYADVIAYLYPHGLGVFGDGASEAIEASPRYMPPQLAQPSRNRHGRRERESTEPPENPGASALHYLPSLVIRFGDAPRTDKGLIFGSNPKCDVFLDDQGISNVHFNLTFDEFNRPIVKDLNSLRGTEVTYNGEGKGARRDFQWIVGGHDIPRQMESIIITVPDTISFQIVVPFHDITSPAYVDKVNRFNQGTATPEGLLDDLGLSNPPTRPRTGAHTPGTGEIYLTKKLGEGTFGVVTHSWNVSTGDEHVVKAPSLKLFERGRSITARGAGRLASWARLNMFPHIVRLIKSDFTPHPQLYLEYVPCGSLDDHEDISYNETVTIVRQCLSALAYLHGSEMPIAHRDIKPANILIEHRFEDDIYVKLGDFGLSRDGSELMTLCGTEIYLAPEVYSEAQRCASNEERLGYTAAVDIWSLGVVACQLMYGLPPYKARYKSNGVAWCKKIVKELQVNCRRRPNELGQFLENCMVTLSPESRFSASDCYDLLDHPPTDEAYFHTSTLASYPEEDQETLRYIVQNHDTEDLATVVYQPRSLTGNDPAPPPYFVRSDAPPPESLSSLPRMVQHNSDASQAPSSSAIRQYNNCQQGQELSRFMNNYSSNSFNPLYVGSSLASEFGKQEDLTWASRFSQNSVQQDQACAAGQTDAGSGLAGPSIPQREGQGWHLENGYPTTEGDNPGCVVDQEELERAAILLQAIGQGSWSG